MIVADTYVLIDFLRGTEPAAGRIADEVASGLSTTSITAFELWAGSLGSLRRERAVDALLAAVKILPLDDEGARSAAEVRRKLEKRGADIGMADSLIAGICLHRRRALLTRNREHFQRVQGLVLAPL